MATSTPISPTVATPLAHRKRRFSTIDSSVIDLTQDGDDESNARSPVAQKQKLNNGSDANGPETSLEPKLEDGDDDYEEDEDDMEFFENVLDTAELEPYQPGLIEGQEGLDPQIASGLRSLLLRIGPEQFIQQTLESGQINPAILGTAFGLDPMFAAQLGPEVFLRILGRAIIRAYYKRQKLPQYNTIDDAAALLRDSKNIIVITGAGISTSLGIPDFRSKETGFYSKLQDMGYTEPEEVFEIDEFDREPEKFYTLAADILPDLNRFSPTHGFIRLLQDKGKLQTNYTQNIDNLEELAGIDKDRLIQCHGSFATATCRACGYKVKGTEIFNDIRAKQVSRCKKCVKSLATQGDLGSKTKKRKKQSKSRPNSDDDDADDDIPQPGVMKPDITFFGEQLPNDFFTRFTEDDIKIVDLVIVIGTSLKVAPVSEMPNYLPHSVPHIYISREPVEHVNFDIQLLGNCDEVVFELARKAGWEMKHDMIPSSFEAKVEPVEGYDYRWKVGRKSASKQTNRSSKPINGCA